MKVFIIDLLSISLCMSAVIAVLLSVSKGMKKNFSARARYVIWLLVMIRLAIPFGGVILPSLIEIPLSEKPVQMQDAVDTSQKAETDLSFGEMQTDAPPVQIPEQTAPVTGEAQEKEPILNETVQIQPEKDPPVTVMPEGPETQTEPAKSIDLSLDDLFTVAFYVWAVGAIIFIGKNILFYTAFSFKSKKNLRVADGTVLKVYKELCENLGVKKAPKLYINSASESPYCAGYFRKRIVVPSLSLSREDLYSVLSHEICHYLRNDVWMKLLAVFANAVHWFNPLAYMAAERFDRELEHSCDALVLKTKSEEEALEYGRTMLSVARECKGGIALTTKFNPKKKAVGERIDNILDTGKKKKRGIIIICAVAVLCIASGLIIGLKMTDGEKPEKESDETKKEETVSQDGYPVVLWSNKEGVKLCAKNEEDKKGGNDVDVLLTVGDDSIAFKCTYSWRLTDFARYFNVDVTGDSKKDHIFITEAGYGTGIHQEAIYVFNGKDLKEIAVEDPLEFIDSQMTFTGDDEYYYVLHYGKEIFKFTKKAFAEIEKEWMLEKPLVDSGINYYYVNENENGSSSISIEYYVSVAKGNFGSLGDAQVSFSYSGNELKCNEVTFVPYRIAETNNENWTVRGYGGTVTITNGDIVISLGEDNGLKNFHYSYNEDSLTATFDDEGKKCVLTYYDRSSWSGLDEGVHMMRAALVDLEKGEVVAEFAPTFSQLLGYHGASSDDPSINEYMEDEIRLHHTLKVMNVTGESAHFYSYFTSDDYRVNLRASVVVRDSAEQFTYAVVNPILPEDSTEIYEVLDELRDMEGVHPHLATAATAFINKDTLVLENHLGCMYGVLEGYKNFEFGDYGFSYTDNKLVLNIEITKSSLKTVPAGNYTIRFDRAVFGAASMDGIGASEYYGNNVENTGAVRYTHRWIMVFGLMEGTSADYIENINDNGIDAFKNDVIKYLHYVTGDSNSELNTPEQYKKAAKDILGVDNFDIPESMINDNGNVALWGHGGRVCVCYVFPEERAGNTVTVKVRAYADFAATVESHLYEFKYEDHGDYLRFISIELIEKGEYDQEDRFMS